MFDIFELLFVKLKQIRLYRCSKYILGLSMSYVDSITGGRVWPKSRVKHILYAREDGWGLDDKKKLEKPEFANFQREIKILSVGLVA